MVCAFVTAPFWRPAAIVKDIATKENASEKTKKIAVFTARFVSVGALALGFTGGLGIGAIWHEELCVSHICNGRTFSDALPWVLCAAGTVLLPSMFWCVSEMAACIHHVSRTRHYSVISN